MSPSRMEAFSDGVLAIIITIMVLALVPPDGYRVKDLMSMIPGVAAYLLSFIYVAVYWNNHHHLLKLVSKVNGTLLWANMHWLFWISLIPLGTAWMAKYHEAPLPTATYGLILFFCGLTFARLQRRCGQNSAYQMVEGLRENRVKVMISIGLYALSMPVAFWNSTASQMLFVAVALLWFIPDRHIEQLLNQEETYGKTD